MNHRSPRIGKRQGVRTDRVSYSRYRLNSKELLMCAISYIFLTAVIAFLLYD